MSSAVETEHRGAESDPCPGRAPRAHLERAYRPPSQPGQLIRPGVRVTAKNERQPYVSHPSRRRVSHRHGFNRVRLVEQGEHLGFMALERVEFLATYPGDRTDSEPVTAPLQS